MFGVGGSLFFHPDAEMSSTMASWLVTIDLNIAEKNEMANSNNMFFEISPAIGHKVIMFQGGLNVNTTY